MSNAKLNWAVTWIVIAPLIVLSWIGKVLIWPFKKFINPS